MRKHLVRIFAIVLFSAFGISEISGQTERDLLLRYAYVELPNDKKITPRFSTIDEVIAELGNPSDKQYYSKGGEDFYWEDFWIYSWNKLLSIYFRAKDHRIIRIDAQVDRLGHLRFPFGIAISRDIEQVIVTLQRSPGLKNIQRHLDSVFFSVDSPNKFLGLISFQWLPEREYSVCYVAPWQN